MPQLGNFGGLMTTAISEFDIKATARHRFTIKEAAYDLYHAVLYDDGHLELFPRVLADATISRNTLGMIDQAMANFYEGRVGPALDIAALEALADAEEDE